MIDEETKEIAKEKIEKGWIDVWFVFEAMAVTKEITENALKKHVEKLKKVKSVVVYDVDFKEPIKVENPPVKVPEAWSQVVEVKLAVKSFFDLINLTILYAPSAIEIIEPKSMTIKIDEAQNVVNIIAGLIHRFASAGAGGVVIRT